MYFYERYTLLKKFHYEDGQLKYHQKIRKKIFEDLNFLPTSFWDLNPIISGSYAINLLFKPQSFYDDVDFYFEFQDQYDEAKAILNGFSEEASSLNCQTFTIGNKKIQLVSKFFNSPQNIIFAHDFKNSSIAITKDWIYIDSVIFKLYYESLLSIRSTQIDPTMTEEATVKKIALLFNRILKYTSRYDLTLDDESIQILKSLRTYLTNTPIETTKSILINTTIYYDGNHSPYQNNLRTILEIKEHLDAFLFPYDQLPTLCF